jgi:hypothetical protein
VCLHKFFGTEVFSLDVTVDDILEVCIIAFGRRNDNSLFYLNRVIIKESWFLILFNFS